MAKVLTVAAIEKLKPHARRREIADAALQGLYFIIQPGGAKSWALRYRFGGKSRKLTIGTFPAFDLIEARKAAGAAIRAVAEGRDPAVEKAKQKAAAKLGTSERDTFPDVARLFIKRHASKGRSWRETARLLGLVLAKEREGELDLRPQGLAEKWRNRDVQTITKRDVLDVLDKFVDEGKGTTANRTLARLKTLFRWASEREIVMDSPCKGLRAPASEMSRDRVLTDDELRWFWKAAGATEYPFGPFLKLLLLTAQRRSEVAGMAAPELNLISRIAANGEFDQSSLAWEIPKERAKNDKEHLVPLSAAALTVIENVPKIVHNAAFLFTTTSITPISGFSKLKRKLDKDMLALAKKAASESSRDPEKVAIERWTLHDLRRTVATRMAEIGIAPHVVEAVLNHKSGTIKGVAAVYNRYKYAAEKRSALEAWGRCLLAIVGPEADNIVAFRRDYPAHLGGEVHEAFCR